jgi:hypothetical protein
LSRNVNILVVLGLNGAVHAVAFRKADPDVLGLLQLVVTAPFLAQGYSSK